MFFGMTNSPPTFQNMMNDILKDVIDKGIVIVFIDDILIFMEDEEHHDEIVEEVLKRLKENDLFLKLEKCEFEKKEIEFLGMIIGVTSHIRNSKELHRKQNIGPPQIF